jgi:hypothetical protein
MYRGADYTPSGRIDLGDDADNIRIDLSANQLFVGYGKGAIAIVDLLTNNKTKTLPLKAHPESFQLDAASHQIFVNLPNMHSIALLDTSTDQESASWPLRHAANFPMALDRERKRVLVAFRSPPKLTAFDWQTGKVVGEVDICGDADDLFHDGKRKRIYISCGAGFLDVLDADRPDYARIARIHTASGARTALFVPDMDRLMLAVRAGSSEPASIWVYKPVP